VSGGRSGVGSGGSGGAGGSTGPGGVGGFTGSGVGAGTSLCAISVLSFSMITLRLLLDALA